MATAGGDISFGINRFFNSVASPEHKSLIKETSVDASEEQKLANVYSTGAVQGITKIVELYNSGELDGLLDGGRGAIDRIVARLEQDNN